jgi:uncharacterized protein (TIGR03067 family)
MFDGIWQAVSGKLGQSTIPLPDTQLTITGSEYVVDSPNGRDEGRITLGAVGEPQEVDLEMTKGPNAGTLIRAIGRVRGDVMQFCYAVDGSARPRSFDVTSGTAVVTVRYKRVVAVG